MSRPVKLLTVEETARRLNIAPRSIYNRTAPKSKKPFYIPFIKMGHLIRFDPREIQKYLEANQCQAQSQ